MSLATQAQEGSGTSSSPEVTSVPATTSTTTTSAPASAPVEKSSGETTPAPSEPVKSGEFAPAPEGMTNIAPEGQTPVYVPDYKYRVADPDGVKLEKEIDPLFRGLIKDKETEAKVKELFEKADGLDIMKPRHKLRVEKLEGELKEYKTGVEKLRKLYQRGDFANFFSALKIPEEKVLQWVLDKAQYNQLPDDQRNMVDRQKAAEQHAWETEDQLSAQQQRYNQEMERARSIQLTVALENPDVKSVAEIVDSRIGKPGAFKDQVIRQGLLAWTTRQEDITVEQAVKEALDIFGPLARSATTAGHAATVHPAQATTASAAPASPPVVLPNLRSGSSAPGVGGKKPKSIDDLRKMYKEMA